MTIHVNGKTREGRDGMTVADLLNDLALEHQRLAVEVNETVIRKAEYETVALKDGDRVEVVSFVGGG